jgi:hypothetical protein
VTDRDSRLKPSLKGTLGNCLTSAHDLGHLVSTVVMAPQRRRSYIGNIHPMKNLWLILLVFLIGCPGKKPPVAVTPAPPPALAPAPIKSQMPPPAAEVIEHCVVTKQENSNTVSCRCVPVTTRIDSKTGHTVIVCKKMPETR